MDLKSFLALGLERILTIHPLPWVGFWTFYQSPGRGYKSLLIALIEGALIEGALIEVQLFEEAFVERVAKVLFEFLEVDDLFAWLSLGHLLQNLLRRPAWDFQEIV